MKMTSSQATFTRLAAATLSLGVWAAWCWLKPVEPPKPAALPLPVVESKAVTPAAMETKVESRPEPIASAPAALPVKVLEPDQAKVAEAEAELDAISRERALAENRLVDAQQALEKAEASANATEKSIHRIVAQANIPSSRIAQAVTRGGYIKAELEKVKGEVAKVSSTPRPKAQVISTRSPVAKPIRSKEYHLEIRNGRVSVIDLEKLLELIKLDAKVKMRIGSGRNGVISSSVGPVGSFSLRYELVRASNSLEELIDPRSGTYDLVAWELVPERENRGEPLEIAHQATSEYSRAIRRLSPTSATITMWVYPDGFSVYRTLRDELHSQGFMVAGRPMPEAMPIRGSPTGSLSAGQ